MTGMTAEQKLYYIDKDISTLRERLGRAWNCNGTLEKALTNIAVMIRHVGNKQSNPPKKPLTFWGKLKDLFNK